MKHTLFPKLLGQKPQLYGKQRYLCRFHTHKDMCVRDYQKKKKKIKLKKKKRISERERERDSYP